MKIKGQNNLNIFKSFLIIYIFIDISYEGYDNNHYLYFNCLDYFIVH